MISRGVGLFCFEFTLLAKDILFKNKHIECPYALKVIQGTEVDQLTTIHFFP